MIGVANSGCRRGGAAPTIKFDSRDFPASERLDAINEFSRNLYRYSPLSADDAADQRPHSPELMLQAWKLGCVAAASFTHSPLIADSSTSVDPEFRGHVILRIVRSGQVKVRSAGAQTDMTPGRLYLIQAENTLYPCEPGSSITLRIPNEGVGYEPSRHGSILWFDVEDWAARVVSSALETLFQSLPTMTLAETRSAGPIICDLVRNLLKTARSNKEDQEVWRTARADAMRSYILNNLKNPEVGTSRLQAEFNASRATVYRAFEGDGGVVNFVRSERLKAIDRDLRLVTPKYGRVRQIAETYGFTDQSAFTKAFKRFHGVRPSEILGVNRGSQNVGSETGSSPLHDLPQLASFWANTASATAR